MKELPGVMILDCSWHGVFMPSQKGAPRYLGFPKDFNGETPIQWQGVSSTSLLSVRCQKALKRMLIDTYEELERTPAQRLMAERHFGATCLNNIRQHLKEVGSHLEGEE